MSVLTPQQEQFSDHLSKLTGLNRDVIRGWTLAEESGSSARQRAQQGNNNWLNIGYFDSGAASWAKGGGPFSSPLSAAAATAQFLAGHRWGASPGIRKILSTRGMSPQDQIAAIAKSGWASSGYGGGTNLMNTYSLVSGQQPGKLPKLPSVNAGGPPIPNGPGQLVYPKSGPQAALDILNAKSPGAALTLYKSAMTPLRLTMTPSVQQNGVSSNAPGVVKLAESFLGTPYKWGGAKPGGFDCSGLVQYVWGKKGVKIPRTTYQQIKAGVAVPYSQLQPGDAVFFGTKANPHHEGMYIGHGQFIEAPHTGATVRIDNLADRADFVGARRFV